MSCTLSCFVIVTSLQSYQPLHLSPVTFVQIDAADYRPVDKKIDHLTEMMKSSALLVRILQNNTALFAKKNIQS